MLHTRTILTGCIGILILWFPFSVLGQFNPIMQGDPVTIESHPEKMETVYQITESLCHISWTVYHSQVNKGILQHRSRCTFPLDKQLPLIAKIFAKVLEHEGTSIKFHTLFLGRLNSSPEISTRLAIMAKQSPHWDARRGQARAGGVNQFIVKLANQKHLYSEWEAMFQRFKRSIEVSGVEEVLISEAGKLPHFDQMQKQAIKKTDKLPYDCLVWFSVAEREEKQPQLIDK